MSSNTDKFISGSGKRRFVTKESQLRSEKSYSRSSQSPTSSVNTAGETKHQRKFEGYTHGASMEQRGPFVLLKNSTFIFISTFCGSFLHVCYFENFSQFANESHSLGSQKSSYPVSSSCAPPARRGEEQLAHPPLFRTKTLSRTTWTYSRHQKCLLHMNHAEGTLAADSAR